jgi:hypothetical protein
VFRRVRWRVDVELAQLRLFDARHVSAFIPTCRIPLFPLIYEEIEIIWLERPLLVARLSFPENRAAASNAER